MAVWGKETEAAPFRRYSSSSTQSYDELFEHEMYQSTGRMVHEICQVRALSLSDLQVPVRGNGKSIAFNCRRGAASKDKHAGEYVRSLTPSNTTDLSVSVDLELESFHQLRPFLKSVDNRPDVALLKNNLPLFIVEVQSSPYSRSLTKTIVSVIDHLRLLSNYNEEIHKCTGFTFPDFDSKVCVTKVEVEWKNFRFNVTLTPLISCREVEAEVSLTISNSLELCSSIDDLAGHAFFFIRLSSVDLCQVESAVVDSIQRQVPSRQSLVLEGEKYFWKYIPNARERMRLMLVQKKVILVDTCVCSVCHRSFFGVLKQIPPLAREDAKSCLYSLVVKVARVLLWLHEEHNVAHLDVRLENICFKLPDDIVMIDFDRSKDAEDCGDTSGYESEMYRRGDVESSWTWKRFDWKQLGMMTAWIIDGHNEYHEKVVDKNDEFLKDLLKGQFFPMYCSCTHLSQ